MHGPGIPARQTPSGERAGDGRSSRLGVRPAAGGRRAAHGSAARCQRPALRDEAGAGQERARVGALAPP
eukprot:13793864-Alexandrium_andersonii.AAC.1